jgi:hypothetical protein
VTGSNRRPSRCKRDALPTELTALVAAGRLVRRREDNRLEVGSPSASGTLTVEREGQMTRRPEGRAAHNAAY